MQKLIRIVPSIVTVIIVVIGVALLIYYKTRVYDTCETVLKQYSDNHLCIATNRGNMVFELYVDGAPQGVERIKKLSNEKKFYDGLEFYRVVKDFVIQGGIQDYYIQRADVEIADPVMREKVDIYLNDKIDVEVNFDNLDLTESQKTEYSALGIRTNPNLNTRKFEYGSLAFANKGDSDPNSNSTEFFIVTSKDPESENIKGLNGKFTNLGKIVEGQSLLDEINNTEINTGYIYSKENSKPLNVIMIIEMRAK